MGDIQNSALTNQTVFLGDVQVTSVDAIFAGGIPAGGDAAGQPVGQNLRNTLLSEADWARTFGLQEVTYERVVTRRRGRGLAHVQLRAKYDDSRARHRPGAVP